MVDGNDNDEKGAEARHEFGIGSNDKVRAKCPHSGIKRWKQMCVRGDGFTCMVYDCKSEEFTLAEIEESMIEGGAELEEVDKVRQIHTRMTTEGERATKRALRIPKKR
uniref:Uncharacterized protein n=1 Tax=Aplanochytrium stocchinoi TaxID=215587 RepID=A0A7S3PIT6_9STRA|mmetsp:Transcript_7908/g.10036  ORF Transcript_7908/g.10036 Transcript_7908/m.10036 type:complete len:108 (+) Transcript_7908:252-575(+)|eukprot:CAMPEP_0204823680 /NCGR_PEP_ID=MMETSP1346-20131115/1752_1 /ASSEMBLY_ACC=CAM_ASM_000771 /TAXON_ID=215587 /ORGANISM="Aplanochytrium stocchinoi, Strain GSBS06" /LENGTH=107 /DNA_ID=CAMNT_0051950431 /DNA_START=484 /DNA_END=807 /DNA_ORIENTATION=+